MKRPSKCKVPSGLCGFAIGILVGLFLALQLHVIFLSGANSSFVDFSQALRKHTNTFRIPLEEDVVGILKRMKECRRNLPLGEGLFGFCLERYGQLATLYVKSNLLSTSDDAPDEYHKGLLLLREFVSVSGVRISPDFGAMIEDCIQSADSTQAHCRPSTLLNGFKEAFSPSEKRNREEAREDASFSSHEPSPEFLEQVELQAKFPTITAKMNAFESDLLTRGEAAFLAERTKACYESFKKTRELDDDGMEPSDINAIFYVYVLNEAGRRNCTKTDSGKTSDIGQDTTTSLNMCALEECEDIFNSLAFAKYKQAIRKAAFAYAIKAKSKQSTEVTHQSQVKPSEIHCMSWIAYYEERTIHGWHDHAGGSDISGVFYMQAEEEAKLHFLDPRASRPWNTERNYELYQMPVPGFLEPYPQPVAGGEILMFPSWLQHYVGLSSPGGTPRVVFPFNCILRDLHEDAFVVQSL